VLGGPLLALRRLGQMLDREADAPPLTAGAVFTTDTLTDARPVVPGQVWSSPPEGVDLPGLRLKTV
jgi:2-oxo-3-hexenedioate decarboxylase